MSGSRVTITHLVGVFTALRRRPIEASPINSYPESPFHPSLTPSPLNQTLRTIHGLHVAYCARNILNKLHSQYSIDHRCVARLRKDNWNRPFQESICRRDRTRKFSRGYPRTAPRTREGIQGLSGRKSETNQLPQPGGEFHSGVLGHSRRGGQPGKPHIPSGNSF